LRTEATVSIDYNIFVYSHLRLVGVESGHVTCWSMVSLLWVVMTSVSVLSLSLVIVVQSNTHTRSVVVHVKWCHHFTVWWRKVWQNFVKD